MVDEPAGPEPIFPAARTRGQARERYGLLLGAVIAVFIVEGTVTPTAFEQVVVAVLLGATLLLALALAEVRNSVATVAIAIVSGVVLLSVVEAVNGNANELATRIAFALLVALAPPAIIVGVVRNLRSRQAVTVETVAGVLCVYILLGLFFAFLYGALNRIEGPFFEAGQTGTIAHCIYFSFTTLTTVGFGDFTARTDLGHTLSAAEALLGQIYLVTVVSLIVANLGRSRTQSHPTG